MSRVQVVYEVDSAKFIESVSDRLLSGKIVVPIPPQLNFQSATTLVDAVRERVTEDTPPGVVYTTSGTSGRKKIILRSVMSLVDEASDTQRLFNMKSDTPVCITSPLAHSFGLAMALAAYGVGAEIVGLRTKTNIFERMRDIRLFVEGRPGTIVTGVPFIFQSLLRGGSMEPFGAARCYAGGDFTHPELVQRWEEATGFPLNREYGLSEIGIVSVSEDNDDFASVGSLARGVKARTEHDRELVLHRQYAPTEYLDKDSPESFTPGNGFLTGDFAEIHGGRLYIRGRKKNVIVIGGMKVVPEEIEEAIRCIPGVADAMVTKRSDPLRGDIPMAMVVIRDGWHLFPAGIRRHLENDLESHKVPKSIELVQELPRNAIGKVVRS